ncbi:MAG: type II toxin-antitoxin system prevent-host-death family antitoxin [Candidatus Taylorbacteria bacterium CG11_big_fil_rev_8_21_14_0_20_46_11]|uniref:Antitoxin n=1 Tax=Candidatus Taylorbacteria bacterium CG11_big_fil_rev_8_21_14_0_20_46_11 TaxID=1975025 RepID=A0A2H0KBJ7_9BACT|nr:MAG: type II toxin-antitoxin system prevent-host-death family antitoxin [Candidatus Taylorbacteria bacterium CG11_big_fil_rev_8_21_14_0_20_46_11]
MITTTFTAKEAKNNFGRLLDEARYAPVGIERNGRLIVVVVSIEKYHELTGTRGEYVTDLSTLG